LALELLERQLLPDHGHGNHRQIKQALALGKERLPQHILDMLSKEVMLTAIFPEKSKWKEITRATKQTFR
jgi:hypothetical protein